MPEIITTGFPQLDRAILAAAALLFALNWLCQVMAHFFPPNTPFGKFISVLAGNAGKALIAIERKKPVLIPAVTTTLRGFASILILIAIFVGASLLSLAARADGATTPVKPAPVVQALPLVTASDEPTPPPVPPVTASTFGGCIKTGLLCFGPSVAVTAVAINLTKGTIEGSFSPGLGYGFTAYPGQWYSIGADVYGDVNPATQQASIAVLLKLVNGYVRIGASKGFIGDHSWRLPIGVGVDL